jgi:hypothetical protein
VPFSVAANRRKLPFYPLVPFSVCSRVSTKVDFRSSAKVEIYRELILLSRIPETWRHEDWDMETLKGRHWDMEAWRYRHGDMDTGRHGDTETWRQGDMETSTWRHGDIDMETWRQGDLDTCRHGHIDTWIHGYGEFRRYTKNIKWKLKTEAQAIFLNPFTVSHCVNPEDSRQQITFSA